MQNYREEGRQNARARHSELSSESAVYEERREEENEQD